jgi:hypothetical protein
MLKFIVIPLSLFLGFVSVVHAAWSDDPYNLMNNFTSYNQDLQLLLQKQKTKRVWDTSGIIQGEMGRERDSEGSVETFRQLTAVELDLVGYVHPWVTGFFSLRYDEEFAPSAMSSIMRTAVLVDRVFVTIGDLDKFPIYGSIGKRYVAFGQYIDYMVTRPLTRSLGRIKARQISVSYQHPGSAGLYATAFIYNGNSPVTPKQQFGGTVGYEIQSQQIYGNAGFDYVSNMADSEGIVQGMGGNTPAFKRIPGIATHAEIISGPFTVFAEYITATKRFNAHNLSFNDLGSKPRAGTIQGVYMFNTLGKQSNVAMSYTQTKDTLALGMPERRVGITYNWVIIKNTIVSLEYLRDQQFAAANIGRYSHLVTAQLAWFF